MPFIMLVAVLAVAYAVRYRERIYAPLRGSPSWRAAFIGGLTASIAGALFNDSGPLLFAFGVAVLTLATAYVRGDPRLAPRSIRCAGAGPPAPRRAAAAARARRGLTAARPRRRRAMQAWRDLTLHHASAGVRRGTG